MTLLQDRFHALGMSVHGSQVECGVPLSIMHVQSTTLPKDHLRDSNMAIATRSHQRCSSLFAATCVHIGTTGDQHFRHPFASITTCVLQWCVLLLVQDVYAASAVQESLHCLRISHPRCPPNIYYAAQSLLGTTVALPAMQLPWGAGNFFPFSVQTGLRSNTEGEAFTGWMATGSCRSTIAISHRQTMVEADVFTRRHGLAFLRVRST
mmetsp:Transcript_6211/g.22847  ORF Transcript_6211/g.22847 Transcript_6211/m.22847 type:complete len:208 (-) Transcript_6211:1645-2268(-)